MPAVSNERSNSHAGVVGMQHSMRAEEELKLAAARNATGWLAQVQQAALSACPNSSPKQLFTAKPM
ncbi:hypothetical protein PG999_007484 [Apiospora kogelbergensis]|uniref:Uncharacterized protein n=1 Tax=Apiospora kogelbergensis TaxID=1337665 RepID=A0AAW0QYG0_9PEZI